MLGVAYGLTIAVLAIHLDRHHIPKLAMGGLAASFAAGIILFSLASGWLVGRLGTKRTLVYSLAGYAGCVSAFPFLTSTSALSAARFFDGAFSVTIWVAAETALLRRADRTNKALVMSLYAMSLGIGYVAGPLAASVVVGIAGTGGSFVAAGLLALLAAALVMTRYGDSSEPGAPEAHDEGGASTTSTLTLFWRTKASCFATFAYGYFQASVVLFLPLYLIEAKAIAEEKTIFVTAFFAAGMLTSSVFVSRLGDRYGHLLVMRWLGAVGGVMVAGFVVLHAFEAMCIAVFVAGATLASISPVSLALQGVLVPKAELCRANALYNGSYAAGMLLGPVASSLLHTRFGGGPMLFHLAGLWAAFVAFTVAFAKDDPRSASGAGAHASSLHGAPIPTAESS